MRVRAAAYGVGWVLARVELGKTHDDKGGNK